ncbi:MAG TPA: hypothetical protein VIH55_03365 [Acidimicrobiia bacterium]
MHESAIVADLIRRVEVETGDDPAPIRRLRFRIGALSGVSPEALDHGLSQRALERWGYVPSLAIELGGHPADPDALGVVLVAIELGS